MNQKCFYLQEAIEIILTPGDNSELSDLDESETEDCVEYSDVPGRKDDDGDNVVGDNYFHRKKVRNAQEHSVC